MTAKLRTLLLVLGGSLLVDQVSKIWTVHALRYRGPALDEAARRGLEQLGHSAQNPAEQVVIPGFFSLVHAQNPAAAMGMMLGVENRMVLFGLFTVVALGILTAMFRALPDDDRLQAASIGFILSGALGNAIDRLHKGTVTDMIKMYWDFEPGKSWLVAHLGTNQWFTYNWADAAIFVGLGLYAIFAMTQRDDAEAEDAGPSPLEEGAP